MKFSSAYKAINKYVWHARKVWSKPKQAKVLIYDRVGSEVLLLYIDSEKVEILDTRSESINLYVLLSTILSGKFNMRDYFDHFIKFVSPTFAITFIDNNSTFYRLKETAPDVTTIFVQNGTRSEICDIFGQIKKENY